MDSDIEQLKPRRDDLRQKVADETERLRKLKMVKTYRTKNNLPELEVLIGKWRTACQTALEELHKMAPEPKPTLGKLISDWNIDPELIQFDSEDDSFT